VSFDLFVYLPGLPATVAGEAEAFLARERIPAQCRVTAAAASISIEFLFPDDAQVFFDVAPLTDDLAAGLAGKQRQRVSSCRLEASLSSSAGSSASALRQQAFAAVALMHACCGVIGDPQESYGDLAELQPHLHERCVRDGLIFDIGFATRWAHALAASVAHAREPDVVPSAALIPAGTSLRQRWNVQFARDEKDFDYFRGILRKPEPLSDDDLAFPVIFLRASGGADALADECAARLVRDLRAQVGGEQRDGRTRRALVYAQACHDGSWDVPGLMEAARAYDAKLAGDREWDQTHEWATHAAVLLYLQAVLLYLQAGDTAAALAALLRSKKKFKYSKGFHERLLALTQELAGNAGKLRPGGAGAMALQELFDALRAPEADAAVKAFGVHSVNDVGLRRLELAVVRERYLLGNTGVPQWPRVFASISA
jgi:hypothetical protein